jgi:hypothetical protein
MLPEIYLFISLLALVIFWIGSYVFCMMAWTAILQTELLMADGITNTYQDAQIID